MKIINRGFEVVEGFLSSGVACGIKQKGLDLGLIYSESDTKAACVFTSNSIKAAPVVLSKQTLSKNTNIRAIVVNSGNANACTGKKGFEHALIMQKETANALDLKDDQVLVASTGVIGRYLPIEKVRDGIKKAKSSLDSNKDFSRAILTTDLEEKYLSIQSKDENGRNFTISAVMKGSGMIGPKMEATMLCFVLTDYNLSHASLKKYLVSAVDVSFNAAVVDGDMSTNDSVFLLALNKGDEVAESLKFFEALKLLLIEMAKKMVKDGEGATKSFEVIIKNAKTEEKAQKIGKEIAKSSLVKTAIFGSDPNWGRIIAAAGSVADINEDQLKIIFSDGSNDVVVFSGEPKEVDARSIISNEYFKIILDLSEGDFSATAFGCDLTYDYIKINAVYTM